LVCQYCRAHNDEEDHRCNRCGRRLADTGPARRPEMMPIQRGAVAAALEPDVVSAQSNEVESSSAAGPQLVTELPKAPERLEYELQASLFGPQEVAKTIAASRKSATGAGMPLRSRRDRSAQQALDFHISAYEAARTLPTSVEAAVYCNAPVAIAAHRTIAAALDISIVLIAIGVFLATFYLAGHEIVLTSQTLPVYGAVVVAISLFYRALFCIADADTLGMHWAGLRLLNFDGRLPRRNERICRIGGACVSIIAMGVGFAWALFDEERLTWHDYISKTFPSPRSM
jgi:uncharacterized RDD family membrane protein YckC